MRGNVTGHFLLEKRNVYRLKASLPVVWFGCGSNGLKPFHFGIPNHSYRRYICKSNKDAGSASWRFVGRACEHIIYQKMHADDGNCNKKLLANYPITYSLDIIQAKLSKRHCLSKATQDKLSTRSCLS